MPLTHVPGQCVWVTWIRVEMGDASESESTHVTSPSHVLLLDLHFSFFPAEKVKVVFWNFFSLLLFLFGFEGLGASFLLFKVRVKVGLFF